MIVRNHLFLLVFCFFFFATLFCRASVSLSPERIESHGVGIQCWFFLYIFFSTLQLRQTHTDTIYYYMNMSRRDIQTCGRQYIFAKKSNSSWNMFVLLSTVRMSTRIHKYTRIRAGTQSHKPDRHYVHNRYY